LQNYCRFAPEKLQGETWVEQQPEAWNAKKLLQLIISEVLAHVVNIPGRYIDLNKHVETVWTNYIDLNKHVETVWTNRNDNQIGARIWVVAACNREVGVIVTVGEVVEDGLGSVYSWKGTRAS